MELQEEGFRFHPDDSELLTFLLRFIAEKDLCDNGFITVCDVYKQEPWVTYGYGRHCGGEDDGDTSIFRYFISPRHKNNKNNERFCRVVGENLGTWKQQDKGKKIICKQQRALNMGRKKSLYYDTSNSCPDDGKWLMKEYDFCEAILKKFREAKFRDYCICAIKTKSKRKSSDGSRSSNRTITVGASSGGVNQVLGLSTSSQIQESTTNELLGNPAMKDQEAACPVSVEDDSYWCDKRGSGTPQKSIESTKARMEERMVKAFWDGVMQSLRQDNPDFSWILKLMKKLQNELCEMSPPSWKQEIVETVDIDILSEVLKSGTLDKDYLGMILEFSSVTLRKLSAPFIEDDLRANHHKFFKELRKVRKARIKLLNPLIKGPDGFEYLLFSNRYGPPTEALISLPLVKQWLSSVMLVADQEWDDHLNSLSSLRLSNGAHSLEKSPITLRAGGSSLRISDPPTLKTNAEQSECKGEKVDLFLRLGSLQLVCEIEGLTVETLPETLKLNFSRLRAVQAFLQKIIVICTSILVLRQTLLAECLVTNPSEMEDISSKSVAKLFKLLDNVEDDGITEVVETLSLCLEGDEPEKLQARKEIMANVLAKRLQAGDSIFTRVSRTIFLAAKAVLLCGSGAEGRRLAENILKRIGASLLTGKLVEATEDLLVVATVSARVHGSWYLEVLKNMRAL